MSVLPSQPHEFISCLLVNIKRFLSRNSGIDARHVKRTVHAHIIDWQRPMSKRDDLILTWVRPLEPLTWVRPL